MHRSQLEFRIGFSEIVGEEEREGSHKFPTSIRCASRLKRNSLDRGGRICGNARNILANLADNYANTVLLYRLIAIML